ncbi:MAG: YcbK family protein [Piscirickettsiaceae bacterium]|nr:YcbK family protein [Piscirickettsiaceae bacterium]
MTFNLKQQKNLAANAHSSRRRFLQIGLGATASLAMPNAFANILSQPERKLSLLNLHTGESLHATYWAEGQYQTSELKAINRILRDHRTGDIYHMDNNLIDMLNILHHKMNGKQPFHVISGYRSPKTNAKLSQHSNGVAKKSLHMQGKAIDIRLPGRQLSALRKSALNLHVGGVGYYPKSDFIHVDTGRVRHWG